jgi:succinoglycan biosynthesis transport protein ExoP
MDETFDFRPYIEGLLRRGWLLVGGALLAAILAAGLSLLLPPTYEATALVLVVDPQQIVQFDPRFESVTESRPVQAYPDLATGDAILQPLWAQMQPAVAEPDSLTELRETLSVSADNNPNLLRLSVRHRDAATAMWMVNTWAELFVAQTNEVLGDQGSQQLLFYEEQRDSAQQKLAAAEQTLAGFQASNRIGVAQVELTATQNSLAAYLEEQRKIELLQRDRAALRAQLAAQEGDALAADQLALSLLYLRAFGDEGTPLELQWNEGGEAVSREQLITTLDVMEVTLQGSAETIESQFAASEPRLLALQAEVQRLAAEEERLRQEVTLAMETYTALARQVTEESITSQDTSRGLRIASQAILPDEPVAPRPALNGVLAAVVALAGLVGLTLFRQWRDSPSTYVAA